jgi:hypothetical protein
MSSCNYPNIVRILEAAKTTFKIRDGARSDLHPAFAIPIVRDLLDRLIVVRGDDKLSKKRKKMLHCYSKPIFALASPSSVS